MKIVELDEIAFRLEPREWQWAAANRVAIDEYFERLRQQRPQLWNGRVLALHRWELSGRRLSGAYFETDFASYVAHRAFGFPDPSTTVCFAGGALRTSCGAFLLGVMAEYTANAGRIYFPTGTPDPGDVRPDGSVDLAASVIKELGEETGLGPEDFQIAEPWHAVFAGSWIALYRGVQSKDDLASLSVRIRNHIAAEQEPELTDIVAVRSRADFSAAMPNFVQAYLSAMLPEEAE